MSPTQFGKRISATPGRPLLTNTPMLTNRATSPVLAAVEQSRDKFTTTQVACKGLNFSSILEDEDLQKVLEGSTFLGFHGSSESNMKGIVRDGFDVDRSGDNFGGFSALGPGLYVAPTVLPAGYAMLASKKKKEPAQLMAVFRLPTDTKIITVPREDLETYSGHAPHEISGLPLKDIMRGELVITPRALESEGITYLAIPLPKFEGVNFETVEKEMREFAVKCKQDYPRKELGTSAS
jgi:hypothetical protein